MGFRKTTLKQAAPILAATWYPSTTLLRPETHYFIVSIREEPVKLLDAADTRGEETMFLFMQGLTSRSQLESTTQGFLQNN